MKEWICEEVSALTMDGKVVSTMLHQEQELIRCKDCQHCYFASNRIPCEQSLVCAKTGSNITPDWFCADGERR